MLIFSVEGLGRQSTLIYIQEITGCRIRDACYGTEKYLSLLRVQGAYSYSMVFGGLRVGKENKVTTIRQEIRPAMSLFL